MQPNASTLVTWGIPALAILTAGLLLAGDAFARGAARPAEPARPRAWLVAAVFVWLGVTGALAGTGVFAHFERRPPPIAALMGGTLVLGLALGLSRVGRALTALPLAALVGVQAFRLPLELVMHQAANEGVMPHALSFSGFNFDIVVGGLAIPVAAMLARNAVPRAVVVLWNGLGFVTLTVIAVVALATSPMVAAFGTAPSQLNTWVAYFPFAWLPAGPVVFALAGHIVIARKLLAERRSITAPARAPQLARPS